MRHERPATEGIDKPLGIVGVEGVYNRFNYAAQKAEALDRLAKLIDQIVNPSTPFRRHERVYGMGEFNDRHQPQFRRLQSVCLGLHLERRLAWLY